jgi:hypothetical protein
MTSLDLASSPRTSPFHKSRSHRLHHSSSSLSPLRQCGDPVAFTLWRGGGDGAPQEDLNYLLEQDRNNRDTQQRVRVRRQVIPQAVSGNLHDIYQDGGVEKLARPVPVFARPAARYQALRPILRDPFR